MYSYYQMCICTHTPRVYAHSSTTMDSRQWSIVVMSLELAMARMTRIADQWTRWRSLENVLTIAETAAKTDKNAISPPGDPSVVDTVTSGILLGVEAVRAWMRLVKVSVHDPLVAEGRRVFLPWRGAGGVEPLRTRVTVFLAACKDLNSRIMILMKECGVTGVSKYQNARRMVLAIMVRHMLPCPARARACGWTIPYANEESLVLWTGLALIRVGTLIGTPEGAVQCASMLCLTPRVVVDETDHTPVINGVSTPIVRCMESKTGDFKVAVCVVTVTLAKIAVSGDSHDVTWTPPRSDADMIDRKRTNRGSLSICILPPGDRAGDTPSIVGRALVCVSASRAFHDLVVNTMLAGVDGTTREAYTLSSVAVVEMILDNAAMATGLLADPASGNIVDSPTDRMRSDSVSCLFTTIATVADAHAWFAIRVPPSTMEAFGVTRNTYVFVHTPTIVALLSPPTSHKEPIIPLNTMPAYIGCIHA